MFIALCNLYTLTFITCDPLYHSLLQFLFALILYIVKMNIVMYLKPRLHVMLISVLHLIAWAFWPLTQWFIHMQDCSGYVLASAPMY